VNPELVRLARESVRLAQVRGASSAPRRQAPARHAGLPDAAPGSTSSSGSTASGLLPAIVFIFSRAGCDAAWSSASTPACASPPPERPRSGEVVDAVGARPSPRTGHALRFDAWLGRPASGVAAHHAGMLPQFKEAVEELFSRGLVKVVFATETLALGINMPARSVVLERLVKWNGEQHADVTPGEYTQLTGRAGRRGIDVEGHAVVTLAPGPRPGALGGLASTRTYPLRSSFRPSYNMAVNLVNQVGRQRARRLLESSFAQFQTDRAAVGQAARRARLEEAVAGYTQAMECDLGDFTEYAALRRGISDAERAWSRQRRADRSAAREAEVSNWRPGDVIDIPSGRSRGLAVVLDPAVGDGRTSAPLVLTEARQVRRLAPGDVRQAPRRIATVRLPRGFDRKAPAARRELVSSMRAAASAAERADGSVTEPPAGRDDIERLRAALRAHPCHDCPDREEHARWVERAWQAERELARLTAGLARRHGSIAAAFDRVCAVLDDIGYLDGDTVTADGQRLRGLFGELDLLAAESLRRGLWDDLTPADLAACVSTLTFQSRGAEPPASARLPSGPGRAAIESMVAVWADLHDLEGRHRVAYLREPDVGLARTAYRWASGHSLAVVLADSDLTAGDFVRAMRQVLDMLDQVAGTGHPRVAGAARRAVSAVRRGVVAYDTLD
jgi:ATP-dependent RNA helicase HelY